jgi:hypothetical protein
MGIDAIRVDGFDERPLAWTTKARLPDNPPTAVQRIEGWRPQAKNRLFFLTRRNISWVIHLEE